MKLGRLCYAGKVMSPAKNKAFLVFMDVDTKESINVNASNGIYTVTDKNNKTVRTNKSMRETIEEYLKKFNVSAVHSSSKGEV